MRKLHLDMETRSVLDLRKVGVYVYAEHPTTAVWCFCYQWSDDPQVYIWWANDPIPQEIEDHLAAGGMMCAHNATFERIIWNIVMRRQHGAQAIISAEQCDCTMVRAYNVSLPGALGDVCKVLKLPKQKNEELKGVMQRMARPRKVHPDGEIEWWDVEDKKRDLGIYCADDVRAEAGLDAVLPPLSPRERQFYDLDQQINDRGIKLDIHTIGRLNELVVHARKKINEQIVTITNGMVSSYTLNAKTVQWLNGRGIYCSSFAKDAVPDILAQCKQRGDTEALKVVKLAKEAGKTSVNKLPTMLRSHGSDHRGRGTLQYYGATNSGRWAGRLWQPTNLPRVDEEDELPMVRYIIELCNTDMKIPEIWEAINVLGPVIPWVSRCLRAVLVGEDGTTLLGGDYSNIEGRVAAWVAGEEWKLQAFRDYDAGIGHDLYKVSYGKTFGVDPADVTKKLRQVGKVQELALGFQGGVGAFVSMVENLGIDLDDIASTVLAVTPLQQVHAVAADYEKPGALKYGLDQMTWTAITIVVRGWRDAHSQIRKSWYEVQDAAIEAVSNPHRFVPCLGGKVHYCYSQNVLWCMLPSGRNLAYQHARIEWKMRFGKKRRVVLCEGRDNKRGGAWGTIQLYGGLQFENIVQAIARDILGDALLVMGRDASLPIVLHVYDEIVSECSFLNLAPDLFDQYMGQISEVYGGLPINVSSWTDRRYVK